MDVLACVLSLIAVVVSVIGYLLQDWKMKIALRELERKIPHVVNAASRRRG